MAAGRILRTASAIVSKPSTGSHVLRIDGYSHLIGVARHGEYVDSSHIGVFLQLASYPGVSGHVHARPWFSLLDRARRPAPSRDAGVHSFRHGHYWGIKDFITRQEQEGSEYLRGDCFSIQCDLAVTTVRKCHDHPG
ncbi:hypothetical protein E2562_026714 [Oryza meyeriana var. granulata]|uniref:MATH domain-containing protein n=1 Tax=Oryza meyeriana var. granulata TaxID=110450 RepID=A0A6G1E274_9ORYZ|nr:hypothetical protein E2562_026714 [Oryza meyeriana var. granulata]